MPKDDGGNQGSLLYWHPFLSIQRTYPALLMNPGISLEKFALLDVTSGRPALK